MSKNPTEKAEPLLRFFIDKITDKFQNRVISIFKLNTLKNKEFTV